MHTPSTLSRRRLAVLAACGVVVIASCGTEDSFGKRYPVSGTVTYNSQPLEKGNISFIPDDPKGVGATGAIANGSYQLSTGGENDGARPGKYKVVVIAREDTAARAKADFEKARGAAKNNKGTEERVIIPREFLVKAEAEARSLIPPGYGDSRTTNLTAEVLEKSNSLDFKLSDAEAPPPPTTGPTKGHGRRGM
jgi:hypothetical protein